MEKDMSLEYFRAALAAWYKETGESQTNLAINAGIGDSAMTKYKKKAPPFDKQIAIAQACGYTYLEFLQYGKSILEPETVQTPESEPMNSMDNEIVERLERMTTEVEHLRRLVKYQEMTIQNLEKQLLKDQQTGPDIHSRAAESH